MPASLTHPAPGQAPSVASGRERIPETAAERHARRVAWGAKWGAAMRELRAKREGRSR